MPTDPNAVRLIWVFTAILLPVIPALLLYKLLPSTADVSGPFRGMQVKLGGAFAGYFLLVLVIYFWLGNKISDLRYEVWTVTGQIQSEDGRVIPQVDLTISPPNVEYWQDGTFKVRILVPHGGHGEKEFPKLVVERQPHQAFSSATVHLDPTDEMSKAYKNELDENYSVINVKEPIKLKSVQAEPAYAPATAQLPQPTSTVLPERTPTSNPQ